MPEETKYSLSMAHPPLVDYGNGAPSPKAAYRNSDTIDFRDVFGGPPRRSSVHEMRYSYNEGSDSFGVSDRRIGEMSFRNPWTGAEEKPVFGGGESRRRNLREDFFDDIFKGNESPSSTPRNAFSSSPGSRVLSPARPLPPRADGLGSPSLPSQFSLPDKLGRGMDSPTFGSTTPNSYEDSASNGARSLRSPKTTVLGFFTRAVPAKEETRHANQASYRRSPLSQQLLESQESSQEPEDLKKGSDSPGEVPHFHFSIYKWANKGIPLVTPLRRVNSMKLKRRGKTEVSSFTEGPETLTDVPEPVSGAVHNVDSCSNTSEPDTASFGTENWIPESSLPSNSSLKNEVKAGQIAKDEDEDVAVHDVLQSERGAKSDTKAMKSDQTIKDERSQEPEAPSKPELRSLHSFIHDAEDEPGIGEHAIDEKTRGRETVQRISKKSPENKAADKAFKKQDEKLSVPKNEEATRVPSQGQTKDAQESTGKRRAKGKVKEFIKIFNHEPPSKPKSGVSPQSQSSNKWKEGVTVEASQQANHRNIGADEKLNMPYVEIPRKEPDMVDRPSKHTQAEDPTRNMAKPSSSGTTSAQKNSSASRNESVPNSARVTTEEADESAHANFTIKELTQDENKQGQPAGDNEEIQATDTKIRQWSRGKEGNIRSLLSTLQYVLWPGNGWKPVPLVDIIEGPAVKRAYQKAMLCLHPDKLQQKGASSHQKYIAEKVFDILQEAWDHFNTLGGL